MKTHEKLREELGEEDLSDEVCQLIIELEADVKHLHRAKSALEKVKPAITSLMNELSHKGAVEWVLVNECLLKTELALSSLSIEKTLKSKRRRKNGT